MLRWIRYFLLLLSGPPLAVAAAPASGGPATGGVEAQLAQGWQWLRDILLLRVGGNTFGRVLAALLILLAAVVLRKWIVEVLFRWLAKLTARTQTRLDDQLLPALRAPLSALLLVVGAFVALTVLDLDPTVNRFVLRAFQVAVLVVVFWGFMRAIDAVADHFHEVARQRDLGIHPFVPLIKKTARVFFFILGVILIVQNLGYSVGSLLAGLGIGGLAVALAAQDSLSNFFGSLVVAVDRPFKHGDFVRIGANAEGVVEEIGLRSTRLRTAAKTLVVIPNKLMATEVINNLTNMHKRRVDQTIGLTYETKPEQMELILEDIRGILCDEPGVDRELIAANFTNFGESSLDIQLVYFAADPNWAEHMRLRERVNLRIMRAVAARGLAFSSPARTVSFQGEIARKLAGKAGS